MTTNETNKVSQKAISKLLQKDDCRTYRCNVLHIAYSIIGHENKYSADCITDRTLKSVISVDGRQCMERG